MSAGSGIEDLENKLSQLDAERAKLILEINTLRNIAKNAPDRPKPKLLGVQVLNAPPITTPQRWL
ncbi:hypothetical protein EBU99_15210 [bacterium]|jgi:hypothetical protein|nr:hypothetical protein [bacterium]